LTITRSDSTAIVERPALTRNRAKRMSVSRLFPLSCGDAWRCNVVATAGTTGRRAGSGDRDLAGSSQIGLALEDEVGDADRSRKLLGCGLIGSSSGRVVPLTGAGLGAPALGTAFFGRVPSVGGVLRAPSPAAIHTTAAAGREPDKRSGRLLGEGCWSARLSALAHPAANKRRNSKQICQLLRSDFCCFGIMSKAPNGACRRRATRIHRTGPSRQKIDAGSNAAPATWLIPARLVRPGRSENWSIFGSPGKRLSCCESRSDRHDSERLSPRVGTL
jgi:hypothetical protein